jgi:hypothetical protein
MPLALAKRTVYIEPHEQQRRQRNRGHLPGLPIARLQDSLAQMDLTNYGKGRVCAGRLVSRSLTLNFGLRYEIFSPVGGRIGNFDLPKSIVLDSFGPNPVSNAGVQYGKHDVGPRVGFA